MMMMIIVLCCHIRIPAEANAVASRIPCIPRIALMRKVVLMMVMMMMVMMMVIVMVMMMMRKSRRNNIVPPDLSPKSGGRGPSLKQLLFCMFNSFSFWVTSA